MRLTLSNRSPWNTEYFNPEKEVVYNVYSPLTVGTRVITICRPTPATGSSNEAEVVAEIEWHSIRTSKIRFMGQEWPVDTFFRKKGLGLAIGKDRIFTAPDGKDYVWKLSMTSCKLLVKGENGQEDRIIAQYKPHTTGYLFSGKEKSYLDIQPEGEHMLDYIMVTFVYIEKLRKERERRNRENHAAGS